MLSLRSINSTFIKDFGLVFFAKQLAFLTNFISRAFLTKFMGANEYGLFVYILTIINIASIPSKLGMDTASVKLVAQLKANKETQLLYGFVRKSQQIVILSSLLLGFILGGLFFVLAVRERISMTIFSLSISVLVFNNLCLLYSGILNGLKSFLASNILQSVQNISLIIILCILTFGLQQVIRVEQVLLVQVISLLLALTLGFFLVQKGLAKNARVIIREYNTKEWIRISFPMMMMSSVFIISKKVDLVMIGLFADPSNVGIYEIAARISVLMTFTLSISTSIVAPSFAEAYSQENKSALKQLLRKSSLLVIPTSCFALLLVVALSKPILLFFGPEFLAGRKTLLILSLSQFFNAIIGPVGYLLTMTGHQRVSLIWLASSVLINIIINLYLVPRYGIEGAAIATMIATLTWNVGLAISVRKFLGISVL